MAIAIVSHGESKAHSLVALVTPIVVVECIVGVIALHVAIPGGNAYSAPHVN